MANDAKNGAGALEIAAIAVIIAFVVIVIFVFMSTLVGALWWTFKLVVLVVALILIVRWVFRRVTK